MKIPPSGIEIANFKSNLQQMNKNLGLSLYMDEGTAVVPTKAGPAPLGGYLSYQLAPTEGNFTVTCNVDLSKGPTDIDAVPVTYPPFPISTVCPLFAVTQCTPEYQSLFDSLQLSEAEAAKLEQETLLQRNSDQWWTHRRSRLTASQFGDILSRKSTARFWHIEITHCKRRQANFSVINDFQTIFTGLKSQNAQIKNCICSMKADSCDARKFLTMTLRGRRT